jgi:hypothetical protein
MDWTAERLVALRDLAASGKSQREAASILGISLTALAKAACRYRIRFRSNRSNTRASIPRTDDEKLRERWLKLLPGMKKALRRDLEINI